MVAHDERPGSTSGFETGERRGSAESALPFRDRRAAVPLRIAPLIVVGLVLVILAIIGAATL
jgi:hypothetical protein